MLVYTLHEPDTGELRYIGITKCTLAQRVTNHLRKACEYADSSHRTNWLRRLKASKKRPSIQVLHRPMSDGHARMMERFFIASARHFGLRLVNSSGGGDGLYHASDDTKAKLRAIALSQWADPAQRKKMNDARRAAMETPECYARLREVMGTQAWKDKQKTGTQRTLEKRMDNLRKHWARNKNYA